MTAPAPDIAGLVAVLDRLGRHGGVLTPERLAALREAATTLQSEHSARLAAEGRAEKAERALQAIRKMAECVAGNLSQPTPAEMDRAQILRCMNDIAFLANRALGEKGG